MTEENFFMPNAKSYTSSQYGSKEAKGTAVIERASTGIKEYYSDGKLTIIEGTRPSETGFYMDITPTASGNYIVTQDVGGGKTQQVTISSTSNPSIEELNAGVQQVGEYQTNSVEINQKGLVQQQQEYKEYQQAQSVRPTPIQRNISQEDSIKNLREQNIITPTSVTEFSLSNEYNKSIYPSKKKELEFRKKIINEKNPLKVFGMVEKKAVKDLVESRIAEDVALGVSTFVPVVNYVTIPLAIQRGVEDVGLLTGGKEYRDYYLGNTPLSENERRDVATIISKQSKEFINSYKDAPSGFANLGFGEKKKLEFGEGEFYIDIKGKQYSSLGVDVASLRKVGRFAMGDLFATRKEDKKTILKNVQDYFISKGYSPVEAEKRTEFALREAKYREAGMFGSIVSINAKSNKLATKMYQKASEKLSKVGVAKVEGGIIKEVGSQGLSAVAKKRMIIGKSLLIPSAYEGAVGTYVYEKSSENKVRGFDVVAGGVFGGLSGTTIQLGTEVPATFLKEKGANIILKSGQPLGSGKGVIYNVGKQVGITGKGIGKGSSLSAYTVDIFGEPLGDITDFATSGEWGGIRPKTSVFTSVFSQTQTNPKPNTKSQTSTSTDLVSSKNNIITTNKVSKPKPFTMVKPKTLDFPITLPKTNPLTNPKSEPSTKPIPKPNTFPIVTPKPNQYPITLPKTNPLTNPETNPFTNPKPNPKPEPKPNTFVGGELPLLFFPNQSYKQKEFGSLDLKGRKKKYTPSLVAVAFNIKGKKNVIGEATGFGIRPIESFNVVKSKKKRGKR